VYGLPPFDHETSLQLSETTSLALLHSQRTDETQFFSLLQPLQSPDLTLETLSIPTSAHGDIQPSQKRLADKANRERGKAKRRKKCRSRTTFSEHAQTALARYFDANPYLKQDDIDSLSVETGAHAQALKVWFSNRRARFRPSSKC
jgi:hypothetical protein